jgi:hypothetical protein
MNTLNTLTQHVNERYGVSSDTKIGVYRLYRYEFVKLRHPKRDWHKSVLNHDRYQYEFRSFQIVLINHHLGNQVQPIIVISTS